MRPVHTFVEELVERGQDVRAVPAPSRLANIAPVHVVAEVRTEDVEVMRRECLTYLLGERQITANCLTHPKTLPPVMSSSDATLMISVALPWS